jgi:hypothetical protein
MQPLGISGIRSFRFLRAAHEHQIAFCRHILRSRKACSEHKQLALIGQTPFVLIALSQWPI